VPQLVAAPFELGVTRDADRDVEVARGTAAGGGGTAARQSQPLTVVDAARDVDLDRLRSPNPPRTGAGLARTRDDLARCTAGIARTGGDDLTEQGAAH